MNNTRHIDYAKAVARTRNSATANLTAQHKKQVLQRKNDYQATAKTRQIEKTQQRKNNTHKQQHTPITIDNINGVAKAVAINKLRFLERVSPNAYISKLLDQARYGYTKADDDLKKCIVQYAVASGDEFDTMDDFEKYIHTHDQRKALDDLNESEKQYATATANDFDDLVQYAVLALWENLVNNGGIQCTDDAFLVGLKAVENQINASRRNLVEYSFTITKNEKGDITDRKVKTRIKYKHLYIDEYTGDDEDGQPIFEIKDINNNIAQYIKGVMDNDTINEVLAICTPLQREILKRVALGNTYESIARVLGISVSSVKRHYNAIKEKARNEISRY